MTAAAAHPLVLYYDLRDAGIDYASLGLNRVVLEQSATVADVREAVLGNHPRVLRYCEASDLDVYTAKRADDDIKDADAAYLPWRRADSLQASNQAQCIVVVRLRRAVEAGVQGKLHASHARVHSGLARARAPSHTSCAPAVFPLLQQRRPLLLPLSVSSGYRTTPL